MTLRQAAGTALILLSGVVSYLVAWTFGRSARRMGLALLAALPMCKGYGNAYVCTDSRGQVAVCCNPQGSKA